MLDATKCKGCGEGSELDFDFVMALQPIVDLDTQSIWGYEALVRGTAGEGAGAVLDRVNDQNRYRFDQMCRVKAIETAARLYPDAMRRLSINFMPGAVYEPAACIRATLKAAAETQFARERIMFEFTEDERMTDVAKVSHIVNEYRRFGFITALDDFGSGYAGLGLLAAFRPDLIKIDMNLLRNIHLDRTRQVIVAAIARLASDLGMTVLAEGIESAQEVAVLRTMGLSLMQGYYFAKPAVGRLPEVRWPTSDTAATRPAAA